ncbi:PAS domain S-box protein [Methanocalculus taiwanensis]|uniref:histidine kinase n=1 Tax=Methanocalculus taiwanensis TaxID=106207 RepID=A0ABD4TEJ2_9EURY|nr:PAS domain S-box protein [Methanocalculus taiwanensis]MCQ1537432.1 PAS domain S-box protein [Methanocalculus taiwanensis]
MTIIHDRNPAIMDGCPAPCLTFFAEKTEDLVYRFRVPRGGDPEVLFISGSVRIILGYTPDEFADDPSLLIRILPEDDRSFFKEIACKDGECACTLHLTAKDGSIRVIETKNATLADPKTGDLIIEGIGRDVTDSIEREKEIISRDRILEAVGYTASGFLSKGDWESRIHTVIRRLGEAADASRAYLYMIDWRGDIPSAWLKGEWNAGGIDAGKPYYLDGGRYTEGLPLLLCGETIAGSLRDLGTFGEMVRQASPDTQSILFVPINVKGRVSGFIGFDECRYERIWSQPEIQALEIAGRIIAAAIKRNSDHQALVASENRFRGIFEHSPLGMVLTGPDYMIVEANPAFSRMIGYSRSELLFLSFKDLTHPDDIPGNERGLFDLMQGKVPIYRLEKRYIRNGGSVFWADVTVAPVATPDGNGYIAMIRDISLRKEAERRLAESEEMHRSFLQHFHGIVYRFVEGEPVFLHGAVTEITGYRPDEIGSGNPSWSSLIHPADAPDIMSRYDHLYASPGDRFSADYRIIHRDGSLRWVHEVIKHRIGEAGTSIIEASIFDITRRREMEEALSRSNEKLNLLQSLTRHDIFNQLMGLSAYTELMKDLITDPIGSEYCAGLEATIERIHRISRFTQDYQKVGVHGPAWQDLREVINRGFDARNPDGITLLNEVPVYEIYADPLLEKVVYNLVDNTGKYGGDSVSRFRVSCHEEDGDLLILLEDDGDGIEPALQPHLFEYGAGRGTGLGLFLISEILSITGIGIEAAPGTLGGAGFQIRVPAGGWRGGVYNTSRAS